MTSPGYGCRSQGQGETGAALGSPLLRAQEQPNNPQGSTMPA